MKLRRYNKSDECIDKSIEATPKEKLSEIIEILNKYVKEIKVTQEELIKTTTLKVKRFEEMKRV